MRRIESVNGINQMQEIRHSTHHIQKNNRGCSQQFVDKGLGKCQNLDYEPMHYMDTK